MIGPLKDLLSHQAWADAVFFHAWGLSGALDDLDLRSRMEHSVATTEAFLHVLKGIRWSCPTGLSRTSWL